MLKKIFFLTLFILALALSASAQATKTLTLPTPTPTPTEPPPGNMRLLEGYTHTSLQGIDTSVGRISKPGGMEIKYENGPLAGLYASRCWSKNVCFWFKRQVLNEREVWLGLTKSGEMIATFPKEYANFYAQTKSSEDIADFLIMILTYAPDKVAPAQDRPGMRKPKQKRPPADATPSNDVRPTSR